MTHQSHTDTTLVYKSEFALRPTLLTRHTCSNMFTNRRLSIHNKCFIPLPEL